jgi:hypothetical protein
MTELLDATKKLLEAAKASETGTIMNIPVLGKLVNIVIGGEEFPDAHDPRTEALYKSALDVLLQNRLIEDRTGKGEVFHVTTFGYPCADAGSKHSKRPLGIGHHFGKTNKSGSSSHPTS